MESRTTQVPLPPAWLEDLDAFNRKPFDTCAIAADGTFVPWSPTTVAQLNRDVWAFSHRVEALFCEFVASLAGDRVTNVHRAQAQLAPNSRQAPGGMPTRG